ncbi:MAG: protein-tyrosine phosphatase family protein [Mariniblastus sp.]
MTILSLQAEHLWLGNALDIREPTALFDTGITTVVDLAYEEPSAQLPRQLTYCRFPLNDGGGNSPAILLQAVQTVADFLNSDTPTIVACSAGMSRSPTIAAFALALHLSTNPEDEIRIIAERKRIELNGVLWNDVAKVFPRARRNV